MRVIVGSDSILKLRAVQQAIDQIGLEAEVIGIRAESSVPNQPLGREETVEGASNRARAARAVCGKKDYAVGIENGLVPFGPDVRDVAYVCVYTPSGRCIVRKSIGVTVPPEIAAAVLAFKQSRTAGSLEAERSDCDPFDPHRVWSGGRTDRKTIMTDAVREALKSAIRTEEGA